MPAQVSVVQTSASLIESRRLLHNPSTSPHNPSTFSHNPSRIRGARMSTQPILGWSGSTHLGAVFHFDLQPIVQRVSIELDMVPMQHFAIQNLHRQRVLNQPLDRALQRPRSIRAVVARLRNSWCRAALRQLQRDLPIGQQLVQIVDAAASEYGSTALRPAGGRSRYRPRGSGTPDGSCCRSTSITCSCAASNADSLCQRFRVSAIARPGSRS